MKKIFLIISVSLLMQSCFVAKNYERPQVVEEEFYRTDQLPQDSLSMAEVSWKELFTDPYLVSYIEEGLQNNIDIRVALQQLNAAQSYMKQGKLGYFPSLNGNAQVTHQQLSQNSQFGRIFSGGLTQYETTLNLSWEADIWGKIRSQDRAFQAQYLQTAAAHQAVKTELVSNIASLYYQLLALDEQRQITLQTIKTRETSLETTRALKEAGNVTEVGVQQTQAQLFRAQGVLVDIENNIRLLENALSILLGDAPRNLERGDLDDQQIVTELNVGVPSQLLRNRPDVMAAEYNLVNAFELTNVARANFYPSLSISATGGLQSLELADLLNTNSLFANIVGSLAQPIFRRRQIKTQYEVAEAQQEIAFLEFRRSLLIAAREVSDALYNFEAAEVKIQIKTNEFEAYELATDYSEELLDYGMANYLEVLTATENALNSQLELTNERFNKLNAIVELYQALGGGWR